MLFHYPAMVLPAGLEPAFPAPEADALSVRRWELGGDTGNRTLIFCVQNRRSPVELCPHEDGHIDRPTGHEDREYVWYTRQDSNLQFPHP